MLFISIPKGDYLSPHAFLLILDKRGKLNVQIHIGKRKIWFEILHWNYGTTFENKTKKNSKI